jgi:hypothetical protein
MAGDNGKVTVGEENEPFAYSVMRQSMSTSRTTLATFQATIQCTLGADLLGI